MRDFFKTTTIYKKSLQTVILKIKPEFIAHPDANLQVADSPGAAYAILRAIYDQLDDDQEHLVLLVLNLSRQVMGYKVISSGDEKSTLANRKTILRNALLLGASSMMVAHNHPTGNLKPSNADITFTNRLIEAGKSLDIPVIDHLILTHDGYISLRNDKRCKFESLA